MRLALEATNGSLGAVAGRCEQAEGDAAALLTRAEEAGQTAAAAEAALSSVREELRLAKQQADAHAVERESLGRYRATAEGERERFAEEKRELLAQNARLMVQAAGERD